MGVTVLNETGEPRQNLRIVVLSLLEFSAGESDGEGRQEGAEDED